MIRLLFVDDDAAIRRVFGRLFTGPDYQVDLAESGVQGLQLIEDNDYDAIISDFRMPRMDGGEFLARACDRRPDSTRILVTAESDFDVAVRAVNRGEVFRMIRKPWDDDALHFAVRLGVEMKRMRRERDDMLRRLSQKSESLSQINHELTALNQQLEERVKERSQVIVDSLVSALSLRDLNASIHARRIAAIARRLAQQMALGSRQIEEVEQGALLHDVGRLAVRDELYFKRGPFTDAEWQELHRHPLAGDTMLRPIEFLEEARRIVLHHRERWDGSGYPAGLARDSIALGARIFAVAEVVEAALCDPAGGAGISGVMAALEELERGADVWFDPAVVDAFTSIPAWDWQAVTELSSHEREPLRHVA